jgi:hypothetical protein
MSIGEKAVVSNPERHVLDLEKDRVLQELERHGYVAEPHLAGSPGGAIYRHPAAPSLLVRDDGRIELLSGQPVTQPLMVSQPPLKRILWGRSMLFLAFLCVATFVGLLFVALVVE